MWTERRLDGADGRLVWDECGAGPAILFLSGGPGDAGGYLRELAELLAHRWRCLVPDLRGTGRSELRPNAPLTIDALIEDLERPRSAAAGGRIAVVGHSFGATLALLYASRLATSVAGIALIGLGPLDAAHARQAGTRVMARLGPAERSRVADAGQRRIDAQDRRDREAFEEAFLDHFELMLPRAVLDEEAAQRVLARRRAEFDHNPYVHAALVADLATVDQWAAADRLEVPTLVLYGTETSNRSTRATPSLSGKGGQIVIVPESAHLPWIDQPAAVTSALETFLGRLQVQ